MTLQDFTKTPEYREIIRFLKKERLYGIFQKLKYKTANQNNTYIIDKDLISASKNRDNYSDFILNFSKNNVKDKNHLVLSQLWRFFLLEEIENKKYMPRTFTVEGLESTLKFCIRNNGYRGNSTIEELFKKHNIEPFYGR